MPVSPQLPDLTGHWAGFAALAIFAAAYALVIAEEAIDLRKSKPVVVAAGLLWVMVAIVYTRLGLSDAPLLSSLFGIRARYLLGEAGVDAAAYASGLLIGSDVRAGLSLHGGEPIALAGRPDLCALYAATLALAAEDPTAIDGAMAFLAGMQLLTELI